MMLAGSNPADDDLFFNQGDFMSEDAVVHFCVAAILAFAIFELCSFVMEKQDERGKS